MIKLEKTEIEYFGINFEDGTVKYINSKKELKELNKKKYNVYFILNDFLGKRTIKDLIGYKNIGIDLDTKKYTVDEIIKLSKNTLGISPSKINSTYKGYHIIYNIGKMLYYIDNDTYLNLYNKVNNIFDGDPKMKNITGVLKVEGFIDYKNDREYKIVNKYNNSKDKITKKVLETLGIEVNISNRKEKLKEKVIKKKLNNKKIEEIDSLTFIKELKKKTNSGLTLFDKKLNISSIENGYSVNGVFVLKYNNYKDKYEIFDVNNKKMSNKNFLFKYYFTYAELEKTKNAMIQINAFLSKIFGVSLNQGIKKTPLFQKDFLHYIEKHSENYSNVFELLKILGIILFKFNKRNKIKFYEIDLIKELGLSNSQYNKNKIRNIIKEINNTGYYTLFDSAGIQNKIEYTGNIERKSSKAVSIDINLLYGKAIGLKEILITNLK